MSLEAFLSGVAGGVKENAKSEIELDAELAKQRAISKHQLKAARQDNEFTIKRDRTNNDRADKRLAREDELALGRMGVQHRNAMGLESLRSRNERDRLDTKIAADDDRAAAAFRADWQRRVHDAAQAQLFPETAGPSSGSYRDGPFVDEIRDGQIVGKRNARTGELEVFAIPVPLPDGSAGPAGGPGSAVPEGAIATAVRLDGGGPGGLSAGDQATVARANESPEAFRDAARIMEPDATPEEIEAEIARRFGASEPAADPKPAPTDTDEEWSQPRRPAGGTTERLKEAVKAVKPPPGDPSANPDSHKTSRGGAKLQKEAAAALKRLGKMPMDSRRKVVKRYEKVWTKEQMAKARKLLRSSTTGGKF